MSRILSWVATHPLWVLLFVGAVTALALAGIVDPATGRVRLQLDPSAEGLVPAGDEGQKFLDQTRRTFGTDDSIVVVLAVENVFTAKNLATVARMTERLESLDGVSSVLSLSTASHVRAIDGDVEIGPFFEEPPTDLDEIRRVRDEVRGNPLYRGSLVSPNEQATAILVYFKRLSDREFLEARLDSRIVAAAEAAAEGATVWVSGRAHLQAKVSEALVSDLAHAIPLIFLSAGLVLLWAFRTIAGVLVPLMTISISLTWTLGALAWAGRPLNLVTSIVPPLVITIGFAYSMHLVAEYFEILAEERGRDAELNTPRRPMSEIVGLALSEISLPLMLTGLTTALGFLALVVSPMAAIREFGLLAVVGVVTSVVCSLTFAPAALWCLRPKLRGRKNGSRLAALSAVAADFDYRHRKGILVFGGVTLVIALIGVSRIEVGADHIANFGPESRARKDYESINAVFGGSNPFQIVIEANGRDAFTEPANLRTLRDLQDWLEAQPEIGSTTSLVDYFMLLNRALHDDDPEFFVIPKNRRLAQQLLFFGASDALDHFVDRRYKTVSISLRARVNDSQRTGELLRRIDAHLAELPEHLKATATGDIVMLNRSLDAIARGQLQSLALALVTIYFVLAAMFTSWRIGLMALLPNMLPVALFFGALGITGIPLSASTSLIACIALGIAVDDTIHYFARFNADVKARGDERLAMAAALRAVARPVTYTSIGLCLGFLALTTSELQNQIHFGMLAAFTLAAAWLIDVTLTPALCSQLRLVTLWDVLSLDLGAAPHLSIPLFKGLSLRQARIVALMSRLDDVPKGTPICREGETGREMYVVIEGTLRGFLERDGTDVELATMSRGDTVGEVALLAGRRSASVDTVTDARLLRFTSADMDELARRYPKIAAILFANLSELLARRLIQTTGLVTGS